MQIHQKKLKGQFKFDKTPLLFDIDNTYPKILKLMREPDEATKQRISHLARVGKALNDTYSEANLEVGTDFYVALDSLNKFKDEILDLSLDEESQKGILDLIEYLRKKIERRMGYMGEDINL